MKRLNPYSFWWWCSRNGKGSTGSVGRWGVSEMGRWEKLTSY
nr:hypothetical protein [Okeania sp. SIO2F4]